MSEGSLLMQNREQLYARIQWLLVTYSEYLKLNSSQNFTTPAVTLEDTCVHLLDLVFGYDLKNINAVVPNAPAADLIYRDGRIAYQITINDTADKVSDTHAKAIKYRLADHVDKLTIFFFVRKAPDDPGKRAAFTRCTAPAIDKLDLTGLITHIRAFPVERLREVADLLERETVTYIGQPPRLVPAICNFPFDSLKELFIGRETFLTGLHEKLTAGGATVIRGKQAIHGMGGVGKTRAAIEYGWAHAADYSALLFLSADSPEALDRNLAALCDPAALDLPEQKATETEAQIAAVLRRLAEKPGWFLILDNVDTPEAQRAVAQLTVRIPHGHILITSRLAEWPAGFAALDLDVLDEPNSIRFLLEHTAERRALRDDDHEVAVKIARHLDGLALALEQAAAWVRQGRRTLAAYLVDWEKTSVQLHAKYGENWVGDYPRSLFTTYHTSVTQLTDDARTLLQILSWLAPDPIPMWAIEKIATLLDPRALLVQLADLHLARLTPDGEIATVHRMLQAITQAGQPEANPLALLTALAWIDGEYPHNSDDVRTWPIAVPLTPHAIATADAGADRDFPEPSGRLLAVAGMLLKARADYRNAEPLYRKALEIYEKVEGRNGPVVATCLSNLAQLLQVTNRLVEAEPLMRRALAIFEASLGEDHPNVAAQLDNLAGLLQGTNRLGQAEPLMCRALAIDEANSGKDHPNVAYRLNNLAILLQDTNRLGEAEPLMRRALVILEASFGKDHPNVAVNLNNLAILLQHTDRLGEAERLMRRALSILEASYSKDHPSVALPLNNLSLLLQSTNRLGEAEPLTRRALAINEASLGKEHPRVAADLNTLALLLKATNRLGEAEPLMRRHLEIFLQFTRDTGHHHPHLLQAIKNYTGLLLAMGDSKGVAMGKIRTLVKSYGVSL